MESASFIGLALKLVTVESNMTRATIEPTMEVE